MLSVEIKRYHNNTNRVLPMSNKSGINVRFRCYTDNIQTGISAAGTVREIKIKKIYKADRFTATWSVLA